MPGRRLVVLLLIRMFLRRFTVGWGLMPGLSRLLIRRGGRSICSIRGKSYERSSELLAAVVDRTGDFAFEACAGDDAVDEAVLEEELAGLEAFREFQANRGFDGAGAGKTDEGFGFGEDEIAE